MPTLHLARGEEAGAAAALARTGWSDVVIKPAVSAASFRTRRFRADAAGAVRHLAAELAGPDGRDTLVQPFVRSVESSGERALIVIDGEQTHAIRKEPRFADGVERVSGALSPEPDEAEVARQALARVPTDGAPLLYARVDLVRDDRGRPMVSELELLEPSLFLLQHPPALERFADAVVERAVGGSRPR